MPINTVTEYGCDIAGTTANRPIRAPHGFRYYNHSAKLLEVYDQIDEAWYATISNTPNTILLNNTNYATLALAFAAASDGDRIYLTSGTYLVSAELNIRNNLAVVGVGLGSIVQQVGNGIVIFKANAVRNWTIDGILLKGTGAGVDAKLLHITGAANYGWTVKNCNFENSWYWGLYSDATVSILNDHWGEVGVIFNCNFPNNITGAQIQGGSEWFKWIGCTFGSNSTGIQLAAGNHNFVGCNVVENTDGVIMLGGGNHGHGSWVGGSFAHNTTRALDIQGSVAAPFTYGFDFIGCNWGADSVTSNIIKLSYCAGINFIGGYWSTPVQVTDAINPIQGVCQIIGMHVYTNGIATITNQNGAALAAQYRSLVVVKDCYETFTQTPWVECGYVPSIAATGADQAGAALMFPSFTNNVTAADGAKGVRLPPASPGLEVPVYNSVATNGLRIYPATGDDINDGATNAAITIEGKTLAIFKAIDTTTWVAIYTQNV